MTMKDYLAADTTSASPSFVKMFKKDEKKIKSLTQSNSNVPKIKVQNIQIETPKASRSKLKTRVSFKQKITQLRKLKNQQGLKGIFDPFLYYLAD
jgi:hypothetical protein